MQQNNELSFELREIGNFPLASLKKLLEKLKELKESERLFYGTNSDFTPLAKSIIRYLVVLRMGIEEPRTTEKEIEDFIADTEEFLEIFETESKVERQKILKTPIEDLDLGSRLLALIEHFNTGIWKNDPALTLEDLAKHTEEEYLKYRNFGQKSLMELKAVLEEKGLRLKKSDSQ